MRMPLYYTTSAPCRPNNAIVIGGVNTAAKRRIQRKALHSCRRVMPTPPRAPTPKSEHNCHTKELWTYDKTEWCCTNKILGCPTENAS